MSSPPFVLAEAGTPRAKRMQESLGAAFAGTNGEVLQLERIRIQLAHAHAGD